MKTEDTVGLPLCALALLLVGVTLKGTPTGPPSRSRRSSPVSPPTSPAPSRTRARSCSSIWARPSWTSWVCRLISRRSRST